MTDVIGVIGLGRFGSTVAKTLFKLGHRVLALDTNEANIEHIKNCVTWAKKIEYSIDCFKESGITDCKTVVVAIGHNIQENILVTLMMKELKIKNVIARSIDDLHSIVLEKIGADRIINPEVSMGMRLANQILSSDILDLIEISPEYSVHQLKAASDMFGKSLAALDLRRKHNAIVIAVKRKDELIIIPNADEKIEDGDYLIVIIKTANLQNMLRHF